MVITVIAHHGVMVITAYTYLIIIMMMMMMMIMIITQHMANVFIVVIGVVI